ncbi:MAG: ATP-binding protein [Acidobacteriota bacterium]
MRPLILRCSAAALVLALLFQLPSGPAAAQEYHVRSYTVDDGLPSAHVRDVTQDEGGRIWFATRSGIARYDGFDWRTYNLADGLTWADQFALRWDDEGTLWSVGAISPFKIYRFADDRWHEQPGPGELATGLAITAFEAFGTGSNPRLAIGTRDGGLLLFVGSAWQRLGRAEGLPSDEIRGLAMRGSALWVATSRGLATVDPTSAVQPEVRGIAAEDTLQGLTRQLGARGEEHFWLIGSDWIGRLDGDRIIRLAGDLALQLTAPVNATDDLRGGLYFGDPSRLYHFHLDEGLTPIGAANGILADGVTALTLDREGIAWIASELGVSKLISRRFARYATPQGLLDDEVTAVIERQPGEIVFGHRGGISILSAGRARPRLLVGAEPSVRPAGADPDRVSSDRVRPDRVRDLAVDSEGSLWLAVGNLGLARLDAADQLSWFGPSHGLDGPVNAVLAARDGSLWVATDEGLRKRQGGNFAAALGSPSGLRVRRIFENPRGGLRLATASGVVSFDDDGWRTAQCLESASCNSVFAIHETPNAVLIGTSAGLYQLVDGELVSGSSPGLEIDRPIYFIIQDRSDRIWFGTDDGVLRWDGSKLACFTVEDGLAGRETNRAAGWVDSSGVVWVGTERGATAYREGRPGPPRGPPIVTLHSIEASGRELALDAPQRMKYQEDDLIFRFRAVSLLDEERITIQSWLQGFESEWQPPYRASSREIRYTNLLPGRYVLRLRAANSEGSWSEPIASLPLIIARPFWQQPWFFALLAATLAATLYAGSSYLQQRTYSRRLEAEVEERVAQLSTEKERLTLTLRNIGDGVITANARGRIELINPAAAALTGWQRSAAVGQPLASVLLLHHAASGGAAAAVAGSPGERLALPGPERPDLLEIMHSAQLTPRHGEPRLVEIAGSAIRSADGDYTGHVLALRDVTEKTQLERELAKGQKLEALGLLAGGIAHDFNNLLTVLLGNLSLLGASGPTPSQRARHLEDAENAVMRARDLTQQLLTFSRGGAPVRKAASISEVIRDSASFVMSGSKVRCDIDLPHDLWVVEIDTGQISQVVNNLLINAIQAMPDGGTVRIVGRNTEAPPPSLAAGRYIAIDVIDHGIGIPEKHQSRVFDPYFSTKHEGRGLGLASAYSIAKKHDGLLTVQSSPGEGTVFSLFLPASQAAIAPQYPGHISSAPGGGRILIMDDDPAVRHVTGLIVEQLGYEVAYAADGREAIEDYRQELAAQRPYAAILMDLTIPGGMGGQEALAELRELDPNVPAIVMSG